MKDEGSNLPHADLGDIGGKPLGSQKPFEVAYAVGDNIYGIPALAFATGAQSVSCDEKPQFCG